jgi:ABC-type lipoprotein export system ATPase subunit
VLLECHDLRKTYTVNRGRIPAVNGIDLGVRPGEFLAVCGRSGSGKSTLLGMLGGLCRPSAGTVRLDGVDLWSLRPGALAEFRGPAAELAGGR